MEVDGSGVQLVDIGAAESGWPTNLGRSVSSAGSRRLFHENEKNPALRRGRLRRALLHVLETANAVRARNGSISLSCTSKPRQSRFLNDPALILHYSQTPLRKLNPPAKLDYGHHAPVLQTSTHSPLPILLASESLLLLSRLVEPGSSTRPAVYNAPNSSPNEHERNDGDRWSTAGHAYMNPWVFLTQQRKRCFARRDLSSKRAPHAAGPVR